MELFGKQQHLYFINQDLADRVKALVVGTLSCGRNEAAVLALASQAVNLADQLIELFRIGQPPAAPHRLPGRLQLLLLQPGGGDPARGLAHRPLRGPEFLPG